MAAITDAKTRDVHALKKRMKAFALQVIQLTEILPESHVADVLGRQLLRAGTSVGANYRAACRAKSPADFIAKLGIVEEEADECVYWLELLVEARILKEIDAVEVTREAEEITAISVASINTARRRYSRPRA